MLSSALNDRIGNTLATIAVSQMLMDKIDSLVKINKYDVGALGINSSISFTINLLKILGFTYEEVVEFFTDFLTAKFGKAIRVLDADIRIAILGVLNTMVNCATSPILSDDMLYTISGDTVTPAANPIEISLASMDMFNLFTKASPTGKNGDFFYGDVPTAITPSETWKSGDLDAFLWHAMNMVEPMSEWDMRYVHKLEWDNRNSQFKNFYDSQDLTEYPEGEMEGYNGKDARDFWGYGDGDVPFIYDPLLVKRKAIMKVDYNERTTSMRIQFPSSTYGVKHIFGFEIGKDDEDDEEGKERKHRKFSYDRNGTMYEFNKDYMSNIRIFYTKPIVAAILDAALNGSIRLNWEPSLEEEIIRGEISKILTKVIESDDTEIEDCYFTFSNDEYDALVREAELRRKGITVTLGDTNTGRVIDPDGVIDMLDKMTGTSTLQEQKTVIKNTLTVVTSATGATDDNIKTKINWNGKSFTTSLLELLENTLKILIEAVLTPRIILIFLINYKFANGRMPSNPLDFISGFIKLLFPVIKQLVDFFIDFLFDNALARLKELMEIYLLKRAMEQLEKFKEVVLDLINNCTININIPVFKKTRLIGNIDNVVGADIIETKSKPDKDNC